MPPASRNDKRPLDASFRAKLRNLDVNFEKSYEMYWEPRMKFLVTGATGFIGSHVVDLLHARGFDVVCPVRDPASLRHLSPAAAAVIPLAPSKTTPHPTPLSTT